MVVESSSVTETLPQENIYAHTKKLRFLQTQVETLQRERNGAPITLLDFGCGNGSAVSQYLMLPGVRYYGVDIHPPSLEYARAHFARENAVFLDHLPEGVTFDIITYADILEHLEDPVSFLKEHVKILKDDGIVAGSVPNGYGPFENENRLVRWFRLREGLNGAVQIKRKLMRQTPLPRAANGAIPYNHESGHVQFYTRSSLRRVLSQGGFEMLTFHKGAFVGAPFSEIVALRGEKLALWNARAADKMPYWAVSTWYFTARKAGA